MLRVEATRGFGKTNAIFMMLAAGVLLVFASDIPAEVYNGSLIIGDFLSRFTPHPIPEDFKIIAVEHTPFWEPASLFTVGMLGCMFGTYHDWKKVRDAATRTTHHH
jgi:hypothetical protein